jgi:3'-5' exoribonuclease
MKKSLYVSDITKEYTDIHDSFVVTKKGVFSSKNNARYMSVSLRDKTGVIEGKIWDRVDELAGLFERNDLVEIKGKSRLYQQKPQITITDIRKLEKELALEEMRDFYPESEEGTEHFKTQYRQFVSEMTDPHLSRLFAALEAREDLREKFFLFPASVGVHHVYMGGLLEHSVSMAKMGKHTAAVLGGNADMVIAGCLLHDIGKVDELELKGGFRYSDKGRLLGHIAIGVMTLKELIAEVDGFPGDMADVLSHIIVSHHGVEEWGSPKKPMCIEALIVHYLDNLDAKVMGVKEHMKANMEDERWSEYHRLYESYFYKLSER